MPRLLKVSINSQQTNVFYYPLHPKPFPLRRSSGVVVSDEDAEVGGINYAVEIEVRRRVVAAADYAAVGVVNGDERREVRRANRIVVVHVAAVEQNIRHGRGRSGNHDARNQNRQVFAALDPNIVGSAGNVGDRIRAVCAAGRGRQRNRFVFVERREAAMRAELNVEDAEGRVGIDARKIGDAFQRDIPGYGGCLHDQRRDVGSAEQAVENPHIVEFRADNAEELACAADSRRREHAEQRLRGSGGPGFANCAARQNQSAIEVEINGSRSAIDDCRDRVVVGVAEGEQPRSRRGFDLRPAGA